MESDNASALDIYGEIDLWDVSLITDMSALFEGKANLILISTLGMCPNSICTCF